LLVLAGADFTDFASHAKISDFTDTHLVDKHVFQFNVSVDVAHCIVEVLKTSDDLPEHHAYVIVWEGRAAVALENIKHGASGTELGDEVIGVGSVIGFEKRENVFVMKWRPNLSFVIKAPCFHFGIWLAGYVRTTYDLYGDDVPRRGSAGADCRKTSATDDGAKHIPGRDLTLVVRKDEGSVDVWAEGGEKECGRRRDVAHGAWGGQLVERIGVGKWFLVERASREKRGAEGVTVDEKPEVTYRFFSNVIVGCEWTWGDVVGVFCIGIAEDGIRAG
jgi:hypothetical protein